MASDVFCVNERFESVTIDSNLTYECYSIDTVTQHLNPESCVETKQFVNNKRFVKTK